MMDDTEKNRIWQKITEYAEASASELSELRRDFHRHPEPGWMEFRTSGRIADLLHLYGCDEVLTDQQVCKAEARMGVPEGGGMTGVIGMLHCGMGPTVALRFDIDALPVRECEELDHFPAQEGFRSEHAGYMHACGHDGHITVGLGTAKLLCQMREQLHGTVKFIFQPAEEGVRGARAIVENGHLEDVDFLLAAHMYGGSEQHPCGICITAGHGLATTKLDVDFHGKASHAAAAPEQGNNALLAAATAVLNLQAIPRHGKADTRINVGKLVAGRGRNIICDAAHMELEVRGKTSEANQYMQTYAERIVKCAAEMHGCTVETHLMGTALSSSNSSELNERLEQVCAEQLKIPVWRDPEAFSNVSEDFSCMSEAVRSHGGQACYFLNVSRCSAPLHNDRFDFQEEALVNGVKAFCGVTAELLKT